MYKRLLPYLNRFIEIQTIVLDVITVYYGRLEDLDAETFTIQAYDGISGKKEGLWVGRIRDINHACISSEGLCRMALEVKFHESSAMGVSVGS